MDGGGGAKLGHGYWVGGFKVRMGGFWSAGNGRWFWGQGSLQSLSKTLYRYLLSS